MLKIAFLRNPEIKNFLGEHALNPLEVLLPSALVSPPQFHHPGDATATVH